MYYRWHYQQPPETRFGTTNIGPIYICVPINKKFRGWRPVVGGAPGPSRESAAPNNGNVCIIILMYLIIVTLQVGDSHNWYTLLSTTAVNDLVMIVSYDPCYTHRSSRSKEGFRQKCWYRSGGTFCCHSEWTTSANVPIPAHSIVSYLGPKQSRALPMMHALN